MRTDIGPPGHFAVWTNSHVSLVNGRVHQTFDRILKLYPGWWLCLTVQAEYIFCVEANTTV